MAKELESNKKRESRKESLVDTLGVVGSSLILGTGVDYSAGLRGWGIVGSRIYGTAINIPTGAPYGKWRNYIYKKTKTTDKSHWLRKGATEFLAFNTFQTPLYATVVAAGSLIENLTHGQFKIDVNEVINGARNLAVISPLVSPALGLGVEITRRAFGLKSAPKKAGENLESELDSEGEN